MSNINEENGLLRSNSEKKQINSNFDDATVIRRTLVERGLRPVNDGDAGTGQSSNTVAITTIVKQHEDEQRELQELNAKFAVYLDRVHYLEDHNQRLVADLSTLKQSWGGEAAELQSVYGPQLQVLRNAIDDALRDQALQELQFKRHEYDLWQIQQQIATLDSDNDIIRFNQLKQELDGSSVELQYLREQLDQRVSELAKQQALMANLLKDLDDLKNELDTQQLERIVLENELQTMREHGAFQDAIYQAERQDIISLATPVIDVSRFYRMELARAISDIRQDFETLSQSQVNELEEYYRVKTEQVRGDIESENERKRLLASEGVIESMDKTVLTSSLKENQSDLIGLQAANRQLQSDFDAILADFETIQEAHLRERQSSDQEFAQLQQQLNEKQETIDSLVQNNVSLRFEMSTYRRLLDVEEQHMNRTEQGGQLQSTVTSAYQTPSNRALEELSTKKMTVQKTARGSLSFDSVDLESDSVILVNEKYSGNDQSFQNWTIRRQIDEQPEIVYQFPSTFSLRPRQTIRIFAKHSPHSSKSIGDRLMADRIDTWGIGQKMITRLLDDKNEEKAIITQIFQ